MNKYISKILISLGFIAFFFVGVHFASANNLGNDCYSSWTIPVGCINNPGYSQNGYNNNGYNSNSYNNNSQYANNPNGNTAYGNSKTPIVNNYYYSGSKTSETPVGTKKVSTKTNDSVKSTKDKVDTKNTKEDVYNNTNNSNLRVKNGLSALALNTSTVSTFNFLPHTVWQWLIVIFLILVIVILMRLINKTRVHNKADIKPIH